MLYEVITIAHHECPLRLYLKEFRGIQQRRRVWFLVRQRIATDHDAKSVKNTQIFQQRLGKLGCLVGHASQEIPGSLQVIDAFTDTWIIV